MIVQRDNEEHYIIIKGTIQHEDISSINTYVLVMGDPEYIKQLMTNLKELIDNNTTVVGDLKSLTHINR